MDANRKNKMKPQFSEFTYGYALTEEMSRNYRFKSVPTFPSLIEEGRSGGYDVELDISGVPVFLQFKRSDYLSTSNAKYYKNFNSKYYRFNLHALKHSKQHNLLLSLEGRGELVFYVAPKFHSQKSLHSNYFSSKIAQNSIWLPPKAIGKLPDKEEHSICFNKSASLVYFCSEPRRIQLKAVNTATDLDKYFSNVASRYNESRKIEEPQDIEESVEEEKKEQKVDQPQLTWQEIFETLSSVLKDQQPQFANNVLDNLSGESNIILRTAQMARIGFGLNMVLLDPVTELKGNGSINAADY